MALDTIAFMSYNLTGLDSAKVKFSNDLCDEYGVDFLSIQEHFKFVNTDKFFKRSFSDYNSYVKPAYRALGQYTGRAKAGLAQLCRKEYNIKKTRVSSVGFRVQGQVLELPNSRVLWLNTYSPTDPRLQHYDDEELQELLEEVRTIFQTVNFDDVVWGSDLNWDPSRNSQFSRTMTAFVQEMGLATLWESHPVPYTHVHTDWKSKSVLDHFLLSPRLLPLVEDCGIVEKGDNRSRHCPIWLRLKLGTLPIRKSSPKWVHRRIDWAKANLEHKAAYKEHLQNRLLQVQAEADHPAQATCLKCEDLHCTSKEHSEVRDSHVLDMLTAVIEATHATLPTYGGCWVGDKRPGVSIPGWARDVKHYKEDSLYWGDMWKSSGRPTDGWIHDSYKEARRQYHYAILRAKRSRQQHQAEELLAAAMEGDVQLLQEMKAIKNGRNSGNTELPDTVGGVEGEQNIAEMFRESYEALFNSAPSGEEMEDIKTVLNNLIGQPAQHEVDKITGDIVKEAIGRLKPQKSDVSGGFVSDALKNAPDIFHAQLSVVFKSWLYHGSVTPSLLACSFLPLLKSSLKDPCDPDSYRAIAGSSLILKTFELVVLILWGNLLSSDSLQFGYKAKTSTTHCTWLVSEVVQHMIRGGAYPIMF